jgi:hypothetical protein
MVRRGLDLSQPNKIPGMVVIRPLKLATIVEQLMRR